MRKSRYTRMYDLLLHLIEDTNEPVSLTDWGRAVGLRRTPYLADLAQRLIELGAVYSIRNGIPDRGFPTRAYVLANQRPHFFNELIEELLAAGETAERFYEDE